MASIFFDIDGTLLNWEKKMPESTREALQRLREKGHQPFICTGRTKVFVDRDPALRQGFDGMLAGCGTHIIYKGEELFFYEMPGEAVLRCVDTLSEANMPFILEGRDCFYSRVAELQAERYGRYITEVMGPDMLEYDAHIDDLHVSKLLGVVLSEHQDTAKRDIARIRERLGDSFQVLNHANRALEIIPSGFSKATAIQKICEVLNMDPADTFAVGDGNNDVEMLRFAGTGITMGDGSPAAKEAADYVTAGVNEDGILKAMEHFGLI